MAIRFELVNVTPKMAADWLIKNEGNRKLREQHAATLARAMDEGKYKLTHQAIAVTRKGRLIDGQHRCRAICIHGKPVQMFVAHDVPEDVFAVLDSGMPRKMHERLRSNPTSTTIMTKLFRLMVRVGRTQEYEISTMLDVFEPALSKWHAVPHKGHRKGLRAAHEAAIVLRLAMALANKDDDEVMRIQWLVEKVHRGDMAGAPPVINSFWRQLTEGVANLDLGVAPDTDQFCRAWRAFDPENEGVTRLQITDHSADIRDARVEFKFISQGVFD
jgi:hypothetical protein